MQVEKNGFLLQKNNYCLKQKGRNYIDTKLGLGRQTDAERGQTKLPATDPKCNANYPKRKFKCAGIQHERFFLGIMI
jgi:hypothetical protein